MIHLRVLGTVELVGEEGQTVSSVLTQPKRLALLAYLALARPTGFHRRDTLLGLLWPELEERRARKALGQSVYWIRRALGRDVIRTRGNELAVAAERLRCDAVDLWNALDDQRVDDAVKLYRGTLLPGLHVEAAPAFEEWLERERDQQRRGVLEAVNRQSAKLESDDPAAAAALLRIAIEIAPEEEGALRRLLLLLDAMGDRANALATYEAFARRLAIELEIEPAPETTDVRDAIAARETAHRELARTWGMTASAAVMPASAPGATGSGGLAASDTSVLYQHAEDGPEAPSASGSRRRNGTSILRFRNAAAVLGAVLIVGLGAILSARRLPTTAVGASADARTRIAIAPFTAMSDSGLERMARDLVITLSASLDGMAGLAAADAHTVLRHAHGEASATRENAVAVAKSVDADFVLRGALVRDGAGVRADMAVYDTRGDAIARMNAHTPLDDISAITDTIALTVLRSLWEREPGIARTAGASRESPGPAALATRSLPALREFLAGEQAVAEVRGEDAADHFARAFALDSTYWFAYWRYGQIRSAWHMPVGPHIREAYEANRHTFPERDRLLIEARLSARLSRRLARTRAVTQRFPDFALAWFEYANLLVHDGPFVGTTRADAREALERALALTPADLVVLQHLFWVAAAEGDTATTGFVLQRIREVRAASPHFVAPQPDELHLFIALDALARSAGDPVATATELERIVAPFIDYRGSIRLERVTMGLSMYGFHRAQLAIGEMFVNADVPRTLKAGQLGAIAMAWAGRGAWDSAMVAGARAYDAYPDANSALRMLRITTAGEWLRALPDGSADRWHESLLAREHSLDESARAEILWLEGVRAATRGDRIALTGARTRLADRPAGAPSRGNSLPVSNTDTVFEWTVPHILATSLASFERALADDAAGAADLMAQLERERADLWMAKRLVNLHPLLTAVNRIMAARWLRESDRAVQAGTLLRWHEAFQVPFQIAADTDAMLDAIIFYERARVAEALDRTDQASRFDREFLRRYDMPVPAHRLLVERARANARAN